MDGNGRWAKARGKSRLAGHRAGVEAVRKTIDSCLERGIHTLSLFAFSTENWSRPKQEVTGLMELFSSVLKREIRKLHENNICVRFIGERDALSSAIQAVMQESEALTKTNTGMILIVAFNYGGHWDIVNTTKQLVQQVVSGEMSVDDISEAVFEQALSTHELPPVDLLIRTSGEQRISNYYLWQAAYAELYFTDVYWPDFDSDALAAAITHFTSRERRFGALTDTAE